MLKGLWKAILSSSLLATMCCFPSVVLVLFGLSSVSAAASLSDTLYWGGEGWAWFRPTLLAVSAATLALGVVLHFRRSGVCTLEERIWPLAGLSGDRRGCVASPAGAGRTPRPGAQSGS